MKKTYLMLFILLSACSNKAHNVRIAENYKHGFSISQTPELFEKLTKIGDFCIKLNSDAERFQPLIRKGGNTFYHGFNIDELVMVMNHLNNCSGIQTAINVEKVHSEIEYFSRKRYNGYVVSVKILGNYDCNLERHEFIATADSGLENLSFIGVNERNALIASTVVSAFYKAIVETHGKMTLACH